MESLFTELMQLAIRRNVLLDHRDQLAEKLEILALAGLADPGAELLELNLKFVGISLEAIGSQIEACKTAIVVKVQSAVDIPVTMFESITPHFEKTSSGATQDK